MRPLTSTAGPVDEFERVELPSVGRMSKVVVLGLDVARRYVKTVLLLPNVNPVMTGASRDVLPEGGLYVHRHLGQIRAFARCTLQVPTTPLTMSHRRLMMGGCSPGRSLL